VPVQVGDPPRVVLRREDLAWREVGGTIVGLDLRTSSYFSLKDTGAVLWKLLDAGARREDLVAALVARFAVTDATAGADVAAFITDLSRQGLLEQSDA